MLENEWTREIDRLRRENAAMRKVVEAALARKKAKDKHKEMLISRPWRLEFLAAHEAMEHADDALDAAVEAYEKAKGGGE